MAFITEIITEWSRFFALETEWKDLLPRSRSNSIFLTWEWMQSWIETVGVSVQPFVVTVRIDSGALVGLAPFYCGKMYLFKSIPYRTLRIIGDYASGAEYPDWIVDKDLEQKVMMTISSALKENRDRWDCIWMPNMAGWTGAMESIKESCNEAGFYCHIRPKTFSFISLLNNMKSFFECFSAKKRQQLRRLQRNILGRDGVVVTCCQLQEDLPIYLKALFDLHYQRWNHKGKDGGFRHRPLMVSFYKRFTKEALEKKWLRFAALKDKGCFKAIQIGYDYRGVFHQLQEGFDPAYANGVGNVLRLKMIEDCIGDGIRIYDFLGGFSEHKRRWLAQERVGYDIFIGARKLKNRFLFFKKIWPTGRFLRPAKFPESFSED